MPATPASSRVSAKIGNRLADGHAAVIAETMSATEELALRAPSGFRTSGFPGGFESGGADRRVRRTAEPRSTTTNVYSNVMLDETGLDYAALLERDS